jgi:molybdopterin-guanine dinucleotide biosynthesis protein A
MQRDQVTALILAGGKATRMGGVDKRELVIAGRTIFERQIDALAPCVAEIIVSSPRPIAGYRSVADPVVGAGPLAGIAAGLAAANTPWLFVLAGDMPYVHRALVELVVSRADDRCDAVGIRIGGLAEPLCTMLRITAWRTVVSTRLAVGRLKASSLLTDEPRRVRWIEEDELRAVDPDLRALHNVNAPEDMSP